MNRSMETIRQLYEDFNARNIDGVVTSLSEDVVWANGMDGGFVRGHDGLRAYWTRQWAAVNPHVEPVSFGQADDGAVVVEVRQTIRDAAGRPVEMGGLKDKLVEHVFHFQDGKVARFDIREAR